MQLLLVWRFSWTKFRQIELFTLDILNISAHVLVNLWPIFCASLFQLLFAEIFVLGKAWRQRQIPNRTFPFISLQWSCHIKQTRPDLGEFWASFVGNAAGLCWVKTSIWETSFWKNCLVEKQQLLLGPSPDPKSCQTNNKNVAQIKIQNSI